MCVYKWVVFVREEAEAAEEQSLEARNGGKRRRESGPYLRSDAEPKLVDDFPTEVKDWMFRHVQLNSDITGIIRLQPLYLSVPLP